MLYKINRRSQSSSWNSISPFTSTPNARTASSDTVGGEQTGEGQNQTANEQPLISAQSVSANHRRRYGWRHDHCNLSGVFIGSCGSAVDQAVNEEVQQRRCCSSEILDRKCHFKTEPTFNHGSVSIHFEFKTLGNMIVNFYSAFEFFIRFKYNSESSCTLSAFIWSILICEALFFCSNTDWNHICHPVRMTFLIITDFNKLALYNL